MVLNTQAEFKWRHSQPYWSLLKVLPNLIFKPFIPFEIVLDKKCYR